MFFFFLLLLLLYLFIVIIIVIFLFFSYFSSSSFIFSLILYSFLYYLPLSHFLYFFPIFFFTPRPLPLFSLLFNQWELVFSRSLSLSASRLDDWLSVKSTCIPYIVRSHTYTHTHTLWTTCIIPFSVFCLFDSFLFLYFFFCFLCDLPNTPDPFIFICFLFVCSCSPYSPIIYLFSSRISRSLSVCAQLSVFEITNLRPQLIIYINI